MLEKFNEFLGGVETPEAFLWKVKKVYGFSRRVTKLKLTGLEKFIKVLKILNLMASCYQNE